MYYSIQLYNDKCTKVDNLDNRRYKLFLDGYNVEYLMDICE